MHTLSLLAGGHIPYRDSKLTRILQPSLGGNAKTAIICNLTPAACHVEETHSTLRFACRAKRVVNNAVVNEVRAHLRLAARIFGLAARIRLAACLWLSSDASVVQLAACVGCVHVPALAATHKRMRSARAACRSPRAAAGAV